MGAVECPHRGEGLRVTASVEGMPASYGEASVQEEIRVKTLLLLRHAKSSWDEAGFRDHDRPLSARGIRAAERMGRHFAECGHDPARVLCSSSQRTRETLARLRSGFRREPRVDVLEDLYLADPAELLRQIAAVPDPEPSLLVIAHNPGVGMLASQLAVDGDAQERSRMKRKYPTGALAVLSLSIEVWRHADRGGRLLEFAVPRELGA